MRLMNGLNTARERQNTAQIDFITLKSIGGRKNEIYRMLDVLD